MSDVDSFIARWQGVAASELSTSQSFLIDLCRLLGIDIPHPTPEPVLHLRKDEPADQRQVAS